MATLRKLVAEDEQARQFVRRWRELVESTDEYPQRRGARLPSSGGWQWTIGEQLLRAAMGMDSGTVFIELHEDVYELEGGECCGAVGFGRDGDSV
jgi:3-deoxy-D-manno-octulosonic acid (KDO) 8-phosphate synthase